MPKAISAALRAAPMLRRRCRADGSSPTSATGRRRGCAPDAWRGRVPARCEVTMHAPPPSVFGQQSNSRSGSATQRELQVGVERHRLLHLRVRVEQRVLAPGHGDLAVVLVLVAVLVLLAALDVGHQRDGADVAVRHLELASRRAAWRRPAASSASRSSTGRCGSSRRRSPRRRSAPSRRRWRRPCPWWRRRSARCRGRRRRAPPSRAARP